MNVWSRKLQIEWKLLVLISRGMCVEKAKEERESNLTKIAGKVGRKYQDAFTSQSNYLGKPEAQGIQEGE